MTHTVWLTHEHCEGLPAKETVLPYRLTIATEELLHWFLSAKSQEERSDGDQGQYIVYGVLIAVMWMRYNCTGYTLNTIVLHPCDSMSWTHPTDTISGWWLHSSESKQKVISQEISEELVTIQWKSTALVYFSLASHSSIVKLSSN